MISRIDLFMNKINRTTILIYNAGIKITDPQGIEHSSIKYFISTISHIILHGCFLVISC